MNTWPGGKRHAMLPSEHDEWNRSHYPGTRQLCDLCGCPTGRCEEDALYTDNYDQLCEDCYDMVMKGEGDGAEI